MTDPLIDAPDLPQAETFEEQLLRDLNPAQRQAVTHDGGPLLIVAGF